MSIKKLLTKIDHLICLYLGLKKEEFSPETVQIQNNQLIITSTSSFKRHGVKESWDEFHAGRIDRLKAHHREKLGIAIGKVLAKKLSVSFEKTTIMRTE